MSGSSLATKNKQPGARKALQDIGNTVLPPPPVVGEKKDQGAIPKTSRTQRDEKPINKLNSYKINLERHLQNEKKPKNTTVLKKSSGSHWTFKKCLYEEYMKDNFNYMLYNDKKKILNLAVLQNICDEGQRMSAVNWMVYVKEILRLADSTFFNAVRMLDRLVVKGKVSPAEGYTLFAMACLWISSKLHDAHYIEASKLSSLSNGEFSGKSILRAEKFVLATLNYDVNYLDPSILLYYFLRLFNLENNERIRYSCMFLLEMFTLMLEFSTIPTSCLVQTAMFISFKKHDLDCTLLLDYIQRNFLARDSFLKHVDFLSKSIDVILKDSKLCSEIILKYNSVSRKEIAKSFISTVNEGNSLTLF